MSDRAASQPAEMDLDILADFLRALGYPTRLELLKILRFPHALGDIELAPRRGQPGDNPDRHASRNAVEGHLQKLEEADLVRGEQVERGGRKVRVYAANPPKLYALTEELRRLSVIYAGRGPAGDATGTLHAVPASEALKGPRFVLVHGLYEGKSFPLDARRNPEGRWVIGRKRGLAIALDYDPYVSTENAVVTLQGDGYALSDLAGSKNGTYVNWNPLPRGGTHLLEPGDVVGVGRSLLSFVAR